MDGRQGAPDGHGEGEGAEDDVVDGGQDAEDGGGEGGEDIRETAEEEGEGEIGGDGGPDEEWGGAGGVAGLPLVMGDDWVVHQPIMHHAVQSNCHFIHIFNLLDFVFCHTLTFVSIYTYIYTGLSQVGGDGVKCSD